MAHTLGMSATGARACGLVLCCDLALWGLLWSWAYLLGVPSYGGGMVWLWVLGVLRWGLLHWVSLAIPGGRDQPVLRRWVVTQCLLGPVFKSGQAIMLPSSQSHADPLASPVDMATATTAATAAFLFWELTFPDAVPEKTDGGKERKKQEAKALFMRVVGYSRPDALHLGTAFIFLCLAVICETFIPYSKGKVIDILGSHYRHHSFLWAIGVMGLFSLGSALCSGVRGGMFMCSLARLNKRIRHMLFHNLVQQEIGFFEGTRPGSLTSRLDSDTNMMGLSVAMNMNVLVRSIVKTLGMLVLMLGLSWELTLLTCVEMPLLALLQNTYNTHCQALSQQLQDCKAQAKEAAAEAIRGVRVVRSFGVENVETQRYEKALLRMHAIQTHKGVASAIHLLLRRLVTVGVKVAMLFYSRKLITTGQLSSGSLLAFVLYQKDMVTNMKSLVYVFGNMLNSVGTAAKVFQYLDRKPKQTVAGQLAPEKLSGHVTFCNVTFSYPTRMDSAALKGVSMELHPGKMTALVGPSGGGKSSCVSLLERFYEPQEGEVLLDGEPLHRYSHQYLHQKIALVSQDPVLFSGSVRHNIAYGLKDCSLESVTAAAIMANAHNFIRELKDGYDTDIGECGGQLSAGEKQRIAIARALVRDPRLLILDEATSCMDAGMQQTMQALLSGAMGRTVLVVAHSLPTVENADSIVFLEDGEVVEKGTDRELMAKRGRYHRLKEKLFDLQD